MDDLSRSDNFDQFVKYIEENYIETPASLLFEHEKGQEIIKEICRYINASSEINNDKGWKRLAEKLGFCLMDIQNLNGTYRNQSPIETLLRAYRYQKDATIYKLIKSLYEIPRNDILFQIGQHVYDLLNLNLKPKDLTRADQSDIPFELRIKTVEVYRRPTDQAFDQYVLLTFASEDISLANKVAEYLHSKKIGVYILSDYPDIIDSDWDKIRSFFSRSKYVCPILTKNYFRIVRSKRQDLFDSNSIDSKYLKYIYKLMNDDFVFVRNCRNKRVRCIVFEEDWNTFRKYQQIIPNIFNAWFLFGNLDKLVQLILNDYSK